MGGNNEPQLTPEQEARYAADFAAREAANALPAPGPLLEALLPSQLTAAGLKLRPLVPSDQIILQRIKSPIIAEFAEQRKPEADRQVVPYVEEDFWALLHLMTQPATEMRWLAGQGREAFYEAAMQALPDKLPFSVLAEAEQIRESIFINFARAMATKVQYAPPAPGPGEGFPKPPACPATA